MNKSIEEIQQVGRAVRCKETASLLSSLACVKALPEDSTLRRVSENVIGQANLCMEVPMPEEKSRIPKICMLGLEFPYTEQVLLLKGYDWEIAGGYIRQDFAPEGKIVNSYYAGVPMNDYTEEDLQELRDLAKNYIEEHKDLDRDQREGFYTGLTAVNHSKFMGVRTMQGQFERALARCYTARLPDNYVEYLNKKLPSYDTECNKIPVIVAGDWTDRVLKSPDILKGGFAHGEMAMIAAPVYPDTPKSNISAHLYQKLLEKGYKNVMRDPMIDSENTEFSEGALALLDSFSKTDPHLDAEAPAPVEISQVKHRRKKGKGAKRSKHITNCKTGMVKALMGGSILAKLGQIQQTTQDGLKREVLKNHSLSSFVETVSGEALPGYQKRLLDQAQERHDRGETVVDEFVRTGQELPVLDAGEEERAAEASVEDNGASEAGEE